MPSVLRVDLKRLSDNARIIKEKTDKHKTKLLAMIKADAYGAGLIPVAKTLSKVGIDNFGVAFLKEAKMLIDAGVDGNIVVFSGLIPEEIEDAILLNKSYSVSSFEMLSLLNKKCNELDKNIKVHIAIDTGMTRLGFAVEEIVKLCDCLKNYPRIVVEGVYTHFAEADTNRERTIEQIQKFHGCLDILNDNGINPGLIHVANSAGIMLYDIDKCNMERAGICLYGYMKEADTKGIFRLEADVCNIKEVAAGRRVSYGGEYVTQDTTKIAVLHIGYADGLSRALSNKIKVKINGHEAKQIGNICMDTCMVDVTGIEVKVGDKAVIFDYDDGKINEIAFLTNTINYEVITNIGKRVDRKYENAD